MKLKLEGIRKSFDKKDVLQGASFVFETGNIYGLLGRNGAGKTTLFNCINDDLRPESGTFTVVENGNERSISPDEIGYVLSTPVVPEFLTAREFLKFFIDVNGDRMGEVKSIDDYFELVSIEPADRDKLLKDYSHGMKNKMQMLVNFMADPPILLLDEPLTSFDVVVADEMKKLLRSMKEGHIIILSTHILELAVDLCDEIVILSGGVLERIEKEHLGNYEFKDRIISALRGDEDE